LNVAKVRKNIIPILENASHPERYKTLVSQVDIIYQDISQRDQPEILIKNASHFLQPQSQCIFMLKAKSIDMTQSTQKIYKDVKQKLYSKGFKILEAIDLSPFSKEHVGLILEI
jgi:fibrillarin-like pre-rRNA processing protein